MTLLEHIESLGYLRDKMHRDAARLTIEMEAAQDVLQGKPMDVTNRHHAEDRSIYAQAYETARLLKGKGDNHDRQ